MKVAFLTTRPEKASARYRFGQFLPYLNSNGVDTEVFKIPDGFFKRRMLFKNLKGFDIVFLQKKLFGALELASLKKNANKIIYDLDDAVMFNDSEKAKSSGFDSSVRMRRFVKTVKASDRVIAGNDYLSSIALKYNKNVIVIPTSLDTDKYLPVEGEEPDGSPVTLGWIGSKNTIFYLKEMEAVFSKVLEDNHSVRLKIVSDKFVDCGPIPIITKEWGEADEVSDIRSFDIGIMPLTDDPWSRGKCGFKLLQYMACGVPSVASPVGVNSKIIEHGVNGFLASTVDEWVECISRLVGSRELRQSIGERARQSVEGKYSAKINSLALLNVIKDLAGGDSLGK